MSEKEKLVRQFILDFPSRPEYSFSNFVVSEGSKVAFDAARLFCTETPTLFDLSSKSFRDLHNAHWFLSAYRGVAILIRVAKAKGG